MEKKNTNDNDKFSHVNVTLVLLFIVLIAMQISASIVRNFWEDEAYTAWLVSKNLLSIIENLRVDNNPPLYWILVSFWSKLFGTSEIGLKSFSILWLVITFGLLYKITKDLIDSNTAIVAVGLLAFSPLALTYAHNARYYSMGAALTLLLLLITNEFIRSNKLLLLIPYIIVGIGLLYTLYLGVMVVFSINIWWLVVWVRSKRKPSQLIAWCLSQGLILLLYFPWLSTMFSRIQYNLPTELSKSNWLFGLLFRIGYLGFAYGVGEFYSPLNPITWLGIAVTIGSIFFALKNGWKRIGLSLSILGSVIGFSILLSMVGLYTLSYWQGLPNRTFLVYPLFLVILAYGILHISRKWRLAALIIVFCSYSIGIINYFANRQVIEPILIVPWRQIMNKIQQKSGNEAVVICTNEDFACSYYETLYGFKHYSPQDWEQLSIQEPATVWWIQTNLSRATSATVETARIFESLKAKYHEKDVSYYAPQDLGVANLKSKILGFQFFQFREVVYEFALP